MNLLYKITNMNDVFNFIFIHVYIFLRKCLNRYDVALSIIDTDEMWDKYLIISIKIIFDARIIEIYKTYVLRRFILKTHKKNSCNLNIFNW